jgi:hypothetical protein
MLRRCLTPFTCWDITMHCRAVITSVLAAVAVFMTGFGALLVFYTLTPHAASLPGLFNYKSATWGDSLALPTMIGALVFATLHLPRVRRERLYAGVAAFGGLLLGAGTQVQWLRDDHPRLNWTLPRPHHFNAAGVYHGLFLTAMCGVTAALWSVFLLRLANAPRNYEGHHETLGGLWLALSAGGVFVILLAIDSLPARSTGAGTATLLAAGIGVVAVSGFTVSTIVWLLTSRRREPPS